MFPGEIRLRATNPGGRRHGRRQKEGDAQEDHCEEGGPQEDHAKEGHREEGRSQEDRAKKGHREEGRS
jgi:hypothetical protein